VLFATALHAGVSAGAAEEEAVDYHVNYGRGHTSEWNPRKKNLRRHESGSLEEQSEQDQDGEDAEPSMDQREVIKYAVESSRALVFGLSNEMELDAIEDIECMSRQWYPDLTNPNILACTNSLSYYPSAWFDEGDPSMDDALMFNSAEECCDTLIQLPGDEYNDEKCSVIDDCLLVSNTVTTKDSIVSRRLGCGTLGYHMDTSSQKGCSNSDIFPPPWATAQLKGRMFYPSAAACCKFFYPGGARCLVQDACDGRNQIIDTVADPSRPIVHTGPVGAPQDPRGNCQWHLDTATEDGCSNDMNYPKGWESGPARAAMFTDTFNECCKKFLSGRGCRRYDRGCAPRTPEPIATPPPTRYPTRKPTVSPTKRPLVFYVDERTGTCVNDLDKPKPEWIKKKYPLYLSCCRDKGVRDKEVCRDSDPDAPIDYSFNFNRKVFFIDTNSGMCVEDKEIAKPEWLKDKDTYSSYDKCCGAVDNTQLCQLARPGLKGGTGAPSPTPKAAFYAGHDGLCYNNNWTPRTSGQRTYVDFNRCCVLASNKVQECIEAGPPVKPLETDALHGPKYYFDGASSVCADVSDGGKPAWLTKTFDDFDACCAEVWDKAKCLLGKPSLIPSSFPTGSPSTPWPTESRICPDKYDPSGATNYKSGSEVNVNSVIYLCKKNQSALYCNREEFSPPDDDPGYTENPNNAKNWENAWERVGICEGVPTQSPSANPTTYKPTCTTRWHPGNMNKKVCTNSNDYPSLWDEALLRDKYFTDTAEECCEKFYNGKRCRVREECSV